MKRYIMSQYFENNPNLKSIIKEIQYTYYGKVTGYVADCPLCTGYLYFRSRNRSLHPGQTCMEQNHLHRFSHTRLPHEDKHNIKKENIGLIEVMGLAVLPARLKNEILEETNA